MRVSASDSYGAEMRTREDRLVIDVHAVLNFRAKGVYAIVVTPYSARRCAREKLSFKGNLAVKSYEGGSNVNMLL